ncbi:MAG: STAS domain-containing protein [Anaerohalosphaera sp.]|nr:STAS domain-containing protein [Anaerohalosphaera sp.]
MGIQNWSENILLVNLENEPQMGDELETAIGMVSKSPDTDVVVDFADVSIITSSSIAKMLKLRKTLSKQNHSLVFASVRPQTKNVFTVTGLDTVFDFVDDQFLALAGLQVGC